MNEIIELPNIVALQDFVKNAEETGESVLVSKEGFKYQIDGASIMAMIALVGEKLKDEYMSESDSFNNMLKKYTVASSNI